MLYTEIKLVGIDKFWSCLELLQQQKVYIDAQMTFEMFVNV